MVHGVSLGRIMHGAFGGEIPATAQKINLHAHLLCGHSLRGHLGAINWRACSRELSRDWNIKLRAWVFWWGIPLRASMRDSWHLCTLFAKIFGRPWFQGAGHSLDPCETDHCAQRLFVRLCAGLCGVFSRWVRDCAPFLPCAPANKNPANLRPLHKNPYAPAPCDWRKCAPGLLSAPG